MSKHNAETGTSLHEPSNYNAANGTGSLIAAHKCIVFDGWDAALGKRKFSLATGGLDIIRGITRADVKSGALGDVASGSTIVGTGKLNLNTNAWAVGTVLYCANTGSGVLTNVVVGTAVAIVLVQSTTIGVIDILTQAPSLAVQQLSNIVLNDFGETFQSHAAPGATETLDLELAMTHELLLDADCVLTFANPHASGTSSSFVLKVVQDSTARAITWPASVDWVGGTIPTLSTGVGDVDLFTFITFDGGTIWFGFIGGQDFS